VDWNAESDLIFQKDLEYDPRKLDRSEACIRLHNYCPKRKKSCDLQPVDGDSKQQR
jgi:hypothetical protein